MTGEFGCAERLLIARWLVTRLVAAQRDDLEPAAVRALPVDSRIPVEFGGTRAGTVSRPRPATRVSVKNPLKFLAWAEEHRPGEVETVRQVRQSFADAVKRSVKEHGGWLDAGTGEVVPVPGVEASEGDPAVRVELAPGAEEAIARAWRSGGIDLGEVLALPAGDEP